MDDSNILLPTDPVMVTPRLILVRESLGLSKAEFADRIGIDRSSYTKIEKADKPLLPHTAFRIWELFGADMNFIYLGRRDGLTESMSKKLTAYEMGNHS
jgi:DNA-binding XRE family transcriptional regulator